MKIHLLLFILSSLFSWSIVQGQHDTLKKETLIEIKTDDGSAKIFINGKEVENPDAIDPNTLPEGVTVASEVGGVKIRIKKVREPFLMRDFPGKAFGSSAFLGIIGETAEGNSGVVVRKVIPGEAAEKAGIREADIINELNGKELRDYGQLLDILAEKDAGEKLRLNISRDGSNQEIEVELGERAGDFYLNLEKLKEMKLDVDKAQADIEKAYREMKLKMNQGYMGITPVEDQDGIKIKTIQPDSPAVEAGLKEGDIIKKVNGVEYPTVEELLNFMKSTKAGEVLQLEIDREGKMLQAKLKLVDFFKVGRVYFFEELQN